MASKQENGQGNHGGSAEAKDRRKTNLEMEALTSDNTALQRKVAALIRNESHNNSTERQDGRAQALYPGEFTKHLGTRTDEGYTHRSARL